MARTRWQDHVTIDPEIHHGDPCIKGTRIPVRTIVASLPDGMTSEETRLADLQPTRRTLRRMQYSSTAALSDFLSRLHSPGLSHRTDFQ